MGEKPDVHSTADYILEMSTQLAKLAADARLEFLAYLLDLARLEAQLVRERGNEKRDDPRRSPGARQSLRP